MAGLRLEDRWTEEQEALLISLRNDLVLWKVISARLGRSMDSCMRKYKVLVPAARRRWHRSALQWPESDELTLKRLMRQGKPPREIAKLTGWDVNRIYAKIQRLNTPGRSLHIQLTERQIPPEHLLDERDRRHRHERDITSEFFGDPRRGQSALDKKMGVFA